MVTHKRGTYSSRSVIRAVADRPIEDDLGEPAGVDTGTRQLVPQLGIRHRYLLRASDAVAVTSSAAFGATVLNLLSPIRAGGLTVRDILLTAAATAVALHLHGLYRRPGSRLRPSGWWRPTVVARCLPTAALLALAVDALLLAGGRMTLSAAVVMTLPAVALVPLVRALVVRTFDSPTVTRILVIGTGPVSERLISRLDRCPDTTVVGHVDNFPGLGRTVLGDLSALPEVCREHRVDRIVVCFPNASERRTLEALRRLRGHVPVSVVPRFFELHNWRSEIEELHGLPLMHVPPASLESSARVAKRLMDLLAAGAAVLALTPFGLLVAAAIKLDSPGPVFFRQERTGRAGRPFRIFKFRTMGIDAWQRRSTVAASNEVDGPLFKMARDPRVTRVGAFLRRTSIDELPQLLNVIRGEMSLVGPRPLPTEEADRLDGAALARTDVPPGITGLWQVSGRSDLTYADLQHLDSVYVRSWSLLWDVRILLQTPRSVFSRSGAY